MKWSCSHGSCWRVIECNQLKVEPIRGHNVIGAKALCIKTTFTVVFFSVYKVHLSLQALYFLTYYHTADTHINTCMCTCTHILNRKAVNGWTVKGLPAENCDDGLLAAAAGWIPALCVRPCKLFRCVRLHEHTLNCMYVSLGPSLVYLFSISPVENASQQFSCCGRAEGEHLSNKLLLLLSFHPLMNTNKNST